MNITEIIKDALIFPSKDIGSLAIYILLTVLMGVFAFGGVLTYVFGFFDSQNYLLGGIYLIISALIGFIIAGYHINVIKSGIELNDEVPVFEFFENFMTGFENVVVSIFYFIIPALIVVLVGFDTNLFGNAIAVGQEFISQILNVFIMGSPIDLAITSIVSTIVTFVVSLAITITVALILFVIFSILQTMAEARLANTGSLKEALNIFEAAKDITRIGLGKVIIFIIAVVVIMGIVEIISTTLFNYLPVLSILNIIITPYMALFTQRALGLLYSDIA